MVQASRARWGKGSGDFLTDLRWRLRGSEEVVEAVGGGQESTAGTGAAADGGAEVALLTACSAESVRLKRCR